MPDELSCDPEAMRSAAARLDASAGQLTQVVQLIGQGLQNTDWQGPGVAAFHGSIDAVTGSTNGAADGLSQAASVVSAAAARVEALQVQAALAAEQSAVDQMWTTQS